MSPLPNEEHPVLRDLRLAFERHEREVEQYRQEVADPFLDQVRELLAENERLRGALVDVLTSELLEGSLSTRPVVCSATAEETEPACECWSCANRRHHAAKTRAAALLSSDPAAK